MLRNLLVLLVVASVANASMGVLVKKVGEKIELNLGDNVKTWRRNHDSDGEQIARHCSLITEKSNCGKWHKEAGTVLGSAGAYKIADDGTLTIEKATKADAGMYSSPDAQGRTTTHDDGSVSRTAAPVIEVRIEDQ